jgi:5'-nucleotidase / UDP-sugar diphosphatase
MSARRKFFAGLLFLLLGFAALAAPAPQKVTILFFNDIHGYLEPFTVKQGDKQIEVGGIARIATLAKKIRAENEQAGAKTLFLVAGDILQGTPMSTQFTGKPDIECLNKMGVNAMTVGNHEFDFGLKNFLALKKQAAFPFLSSNLVWKQSGQLVAEPYARFKISEKVYLTVIGATTPEMITITKSMNTSRLDALNPVDTVNKFFRASAKKGPVILLSHNKHVTDEAIAKKSPGLVAIIAGHDHLLFNPPEMVGKVPVFQAFEKGRYLGRLDLQVDTITGRTALASYQYMPITADIALDPEIKQIVDSYAAQLDAKFKQVIGENKTYLNGERGRVRYEETNLGDFVADVIRESTGADAALINGGSLRASIDQGPVTVEAVFRTMPYPDELQVLELTGKELLEVLTRSVKGLREDEDGGFLDVSGTRFKIEGKAPEDVTIGGKPLELEKNYKVAVTDFLASGGDGYNMLVGKPAVKTGLPLRELIVEAIKQKGAVDVKTDGRIERK